MPDRQMTDEPRFIGDDLTGIARILGNFLLDIFFGKRDAKVGPLGIGNVHVDVFVAAKDR